MQHTTLADVKRWREYLHAHPELSLQEFETSSYIRSELDALGIPYETPMETATIGIIDVGADSAILLRADIDALPIQEQNDIPFCSQNPGKMHACGHDAHTAMLLGAVKELWSLKDSHALAVNVVFVFQPSEESIGGANLLCQAYPFDQHHIKGAFALHINPDYPEGHIISKIGPIMASCNEFTVDIHGKSAHVGQREQGTDAINAAFQVYQQCLSIPIYHLDSKHTNIVHIGRMVAGEVMNAVPQCGHMEGTIRTYDSNDFAIISEQMTRISESIRLSTGCQVDIQLKNGYPAVINDRNLFNYTRLCAEKAQISFIQREDPYLLGEDFSFFASIAPVSYAFIGIRNEELGYVSGLHTPTLQLREEALLCGIDYFVTLATSFADNFPHQPA